MTKNQPKKKMSQSKASVRNMHTFICDFADRGTRTVLEIAVPEPGVPEKANINWYRGTLHPEDRAAYQRWRASILADMESADHRRHWFDPDPDYAAAEMEPTA
jgi:hypothetical protein